MRYLILSLLIVFSFFSTKNTLYAYSPSLALQSSLEQKSQLLEEIVSHKWEPFRETIITLLQDILERWTESYAASPDKVIYILSFLIDWLEEGRITWETIVEEDIKNTPLTRQDFDVTYNGFSIVQLPDQIIATVRNNWPLWQSNDDSFEYLAGFIFWDNSSSAEIAMTSPVTRTQLDASTYETAFIMPNWWTMETLPSPNTDRITLKNLPWSLKAVRRFSWRVTEKAFDTQRTAFQSDLAAQWIIWYGLPTLSLYDGPRVSWSLRRNEIWVDLNPKK